jgi:hypothetical protein
MSHDGWILTLPASCQQTRMTYTIAVCREKKTPHDGERKCLKHVEFHAKNKSEKLVHLVGFIVRNNAAHLQIHMAAVLFISQIFILSDTLMFH